MNPRTVYKPVTIASSVVTSTFTMPACILTWTWPEAIEVANRVVEGRATVRREGNRWAVRWQYRPMLINGAA